MTNQNKNTVLVVGFIIVLTVCYQLAISNTIVLKKQYNELKQQELLFKNAPKQLSLLKQKQNHYNRLLKKYQLDGSSLQNNLLKTINTYSNTHDIKVVAFLEPHNTLKEDIIIKTYQFTLEGNYNGILKLIHKLEQDTKFGEIKSLHFKKEKNYRTGKYYLQAKILLKSFG